MNLERSALCCLTRIDVPSYLRGRCALRDFEVVGRPEVHPELRGRPEVASSRKISPGWTGGNAVLVVDQDAVLPAPIPTHRFQVIAWKRSQILEPPRGRGTGL